MKYLNTIDFSGVVNVVMVTQFIKENRLVNTDTFRYFLSVGERILIINTG